MKLIYTFCILHIMIFTTTCLGQLAYGNIERNIITTNTVEAHDLMFFSDRQIYTTGGLTFLYPTGLFSISPNIQISVQPVASHPATETYVAEISVSNNTDCTIMVYQVTAGVVNEAPDGSVIVHVWAIEDPV